MTTRSLTLLATALAASQLGATDCGQVIRDPGFDLWCGEELCTWKLDRGQIRQIATWHAGDDGVELVDDDVAIHQLTPVTSSDGACIEFELLADVAPGPDVRMQVDVYGDGSIELDEAIPASAWAPLRYRFQINGSYQGVRFWIVKAGAGRAAVAQLAAHTFNCSEGASRVIDAGPGPLGARCLFPTECASGVCTGFAAPFDEPRRCSTCTPGAACPTPGDVCGVGVPPQHTLAPYSTCVPSGSRELGELCATGPECATGVCAVFVCSTCFGASCGGGETCALALEVPRDDGFGPYPAPLVCSPGAGLRTTGEPCGTGADCASGQCAGAPREICSDGRPCATDRDCPVDSGLAHGRCETIGVIGGSCQ